MFVEVIVLSSAKNPFLEKQTFRFAQSDKLNRLERFNLSRLH